MLKTMETRATEEESGKQDIGQVFHRDVQFSLWQELQWRIYELDTDILSEYRVCDQVDEHINLVGSCNVLPVYTKASRPIILSFTSEACLTDSFQTLPQSDIPDPT